MKYAVGEKVGISIKTMIVDGADMDYVDISSTEIRKGLKTSAKIEGYIKENGLYKI